MTTKTSPDNIKPSSQTRILLFSGVMLAAAVLIYSFFNPSFSWVRLTLLGIGALLTGLGVWLPHKQISFSEQTRKIVTALLNIYEKGFLILAAAIFTFLTLEFGYRLLIRFYGDTIRNNLTGKPFILESDMVYQNAPFDYDAYLTFVGESYQNNYQQKEGYYVSTNFESDDFNVIDGFRRTSFQPETYQNRIFIFGGSTVFSIETPDAYTIPSLLQQDLNNSRYNNYRVESRGIPGGYSSEELAALKDMDIQSGDVVIFYDGINEIFRYLMDRAPKRFDNLIYYMKKSLLLNDFVIPRLPIPRYDDPKAYQEEIYRAYYQNLLSAQAYVQENNGIFIHILQPALYSTPNPTAREQNLLENIDTLYPGWIEAYHLGYQALTHVHEDLAEEGCPSYDFQQALDGEKRQEEIFLDDLHLNPKGNAIIADLIFNLFEEEALLAPAP